MTERRQDRSRVRQGQLFTLQVVANILCLGALIFFMVFTSLRISDINQRQLDAVQQQNTAQICSQADIVGAVKKIGRSLGLPTDDIVVPDTEGLNCP
jgi:hypothetical protein